MRTWLKNDLFSALPNEVKTAIVTVHKTYCAPGKPSPTQSCTDDVWLPSAREVGFTGFETSGVVYTERFSSNDARIKCDSEGKADRWITRSAYTNMGVAIVYSDGSKTATDFGNAHGVVLGFCT